MQASAAERKPLSIEDALAAVRAAVPASSQRRVAKAIGVNEGTVSRWLGGDSTPEGRSRELLLAWAEAQQGIDRTRLTVAPTDVAGIRTAIRELRATLARLEEAALAAEATDRDATLAANRREATRRRAAGTPRRRAKGDE